MEIFSKIRDLKFAHASTDPPDQSWMSVAGKIETVVPKAICFLGKQRSF